MQEKDPLWLQVFNQFASIIYVMVMSAFFGVVRYLNGLGKRWSDFSFWRLLASAITGAGNGYLSFLYCDYIGLSWQATALISGASGAMGAEIVNTIINFIRIRMSNDNGTPKT